MTRSTFFRLLLALKMLSAGLSEVFYYLLPRKWKDTGWNSPWVYWLMREAMHILARNLEFTALVSREYRSGGKKIGDTLTIRKPIMFLL